MEQHSLESQPARNGRKRSSGRYPVPFPTNEERSASPTLSLGVDKRRPASEKGYQNGVSKLPQQLYEKKKTSREEEPIFTRKECATPESIKEELSKCSHDREKYDVFARLLEKQKIEATVLSDLHRQFNMVEKADELKQIADQNAYSISWLNRRSQQHRPIPYTFELVNMPQANVNVDLPANVLEVTEIRAIDYCIPSDCGGALESYVQLEIAYPPAKKPQKVKSDWIRYLNGISYHPKPMQFTIDINSESYMRLLKLKEQLKATVYYSRGLAKRSGIFGWTYFTISDLLHSANVHLTANLNAEGGAVPGYLKIQLRQRTPVQGSKFTSRCKPWLVLVADNLTTLKSPGQTEDVRHATTPHSSTKTPLNNQQHTPVRLLRSSSDILKELEQFLNSPRGPRVKVSVLRSQMDALNEQFRMGRLEKDQLSSYLEELQYLLDRYKVGRKDTEGQADMQLYKQYLKRETLIRNELDRYKAGARRENGISSSTRKTITEPISNNEQSRTHGNNHVRSRPVHTHQVMARENLRQKPSDNRILHEEVVGTPLSVEQPSLVRINRGRCIVRSPSNGESVTRSWNQAHINQPPVSILRKSNNHARHNRDPKSSLLVYTAEQN